MIESEEIFGNYCVFFFQFLLSILKKGEINVLDEGVVSGEGIDNSKNLQKIFLTAGEGSTIYFPEGVKENTILSNKTLHPSVMITGNKVYSNRARAFLLQTENVVVENCEIYGTALPAVLVAPDIVNWYEVGPGKNITIKNNTFENCGKHFNGVIQLASSHDGNFGRYGATVNKSIVVESNLFKNCGVSAVFAVSTNGLTVTNNTFDDDYDGEGYKDYAIYAENSDNVIVKENKLKNPNDKLFGENNFNNTVI